MQFRNIMLTSGKNLHIRNYQLVVDADNGVTFPLEDINSVMIEHSDVWLSSRLLSTLAEYGIVLYLCDKQHMPNAVLLPILKYSRHYKLLKQQMSITKPLQKRLWQQIIKQKVQNQSICLELSNLDGSVELNQMSSAVLSGDTSHVEAKAAAFYFKKLFGKDYSRKRECKINTALNYAYSILRGQIARALITSGFEPSLGIWHRSELNSFNLADDFIEPFRPFADAFVYCNIDSSTDACLTTDERRALFSIINYDLEMGKEKCIIRTCIDKAISSYVRILNKEDEKLELPRLITLKEHRYV